MVNDLEFAKTWVDARRKSKQKSQLALKAELFQKGIAREIIEEVMSAQSGNSEEELATQALEKKIKSWMNLDRQGLKKKAYDFLARRGFRYETISIIVAKVIGKM